MQRVREEDGTSLIEMMIAILVLGVAMTALAQTLIQSLQATRESQDVQVVTAGVQGIIEDLQSLDWSTAALYSVDIAAADARWSDRLDGAGQLDGADVVRVTGPSTPTDRDNQIPRPHETATTDGTAYTYDVYPVWVDRSQVLGAVDTKRFVVIASWNDPIGGAQELRFEAERAPSQAEAGSNSSGGRFIFTLASPDPVDANTSDGTIDQSISIQARSNVGMNAFVTATLEWNEPRLNAGGTLVGYDAVSQNVTLNGTEFVTGTGYVAFSGTFNGRRGNVSTNGKYRFPNARVSVQISGTPAAGGGAVTAQTGFTVRNSPYADGAADGSPTPTPSPTPTTGVDYGYVNDPQVDFTSVSTFCRRNGNHRLGGPVTVTLRVRDVVPPAGTVGADAVVNVTYPYWTATSTPGAPDGTNSVAAIFTSGTRDSSVWTATISPDNSQHFKSGASLTLTTTLQRSSDGGNDIDSRSVTVTSC